ncbi:polysaccharide pyruvyl transferase family protein [Aestuariibaculum sp. YM273]|uniref:polysaccharide pyruvyl transferase family protein n=1 Tax=Aestuariibaculum sp. YM273 TaxID=3070659 RepID=UPI0027DBA67D|nr:polysaccharide pyruvyl transferase family protein [Aestuariibaculum sp. YM273]WMI66632.1 polysaccharide pyruvyl transferase family protein [Aestuariibaculum sp. YM273]
MTIQIDGTNTLNKGAELMLYAVLEEIEKSHPDALIYYNSNYVGEEKLNIKSSLKIKKRLALHYGRYPKAILRRLKLPYTYFTSKYPIDNIDLVLDAAGFQFSDQWNYSKESLVVIEKYYKKLKENGAKIVFLPQAFGPFETTEGRKSIEIINKYSDLIIARERISLEHLLKAGGDKNKVLMYSDFTLSVKGKLSEEYNFVKGKVCIIPNQKMITHTKTGSLEYVDFMEQTIREIQRKGKDVFLLNHEGEGDFDICNQINAKFENKLRVVSGLNSKEVKGVIGASFMVISSRFHGVASALNQGVPCLATSWNHKYEMLFEDFKQNNRILDVKNSIIGDEMLKIDELLKDYDNIKSILQEAKINLNKANTEMWTKVWSLIK